MRSARLTQDQGELVATDLIVADGQHVAQPQAAGVSDENPGWQQQLVRAARSTPRHLRGYRKQVPQLLMRPRADERRVSLDPPEGSTYTGVHHEAVAERGLAKGVQHPSVILHGGRSQAMKSLGEVSVDPLLSQVAGQPGQAFAQDEQLLAIAGGSSDSRSVAGGVVQEGDHFVYQLVGAGEGVSYPQGRHGWHASKSDTIPPALGRAPLAQLNRAGGWWGKATAALLPILSALWWVLLASAIVCNASATAATLFLLGQLGSARRELRKVRLPRRGF